GFGYCLYPSYALLRFKLIAQSRMGRATRNPSLKESIMMGFGYRLSPSALIGVCTYCINLKKQ
ncbi:MAG: hypothetical protein WCP01_14715, partial [Methylococcaceae bacterium]